MITNHSKQPGIDVDQSSRLHPVLKLRLRRMAVSMKRQNATTWLWWFPDASWCPLWVI